MKKTFTILLFVFLYFYNSVNALTVTSVMDGNWTNPLTWGGTLPVPGNTIIINHAITFDSDWGYSTGSITINQNGSLTGNSAMRGLLLNGGTLTVIGVLNVSRVSLLSGTATNNGTFQMDSLYVTTSLTNNSNKIIHAANFMIGNGGTFINNGTVQSTNFFNISTVTNNNSITSDDLMNSKNFENNTLGVINVNHDFQNSDSISSPAIFTNDGLVVVSHDWQNTNQINGSGKFCIQNNTNNSGSMTGTFDFCDLSGGDLDLNTGTVASTITICNFTCNVGIDNELNTSKISVYPNPSSGAFTFSIQNKSTNMTLNIISMLGECIYSTTVNSETVNINLNKQAKGIYFYQVKTEKEIINSGKIILK